MKKTKLKKLIFSASLSVATTSIIAVSCNNQPTKKDEVKKPIKEIQQPSQDQTKKPDQEIKKPESKPIVEKPVVVTKTNADKLAVYKELNTEIDKIAKKDEFNSKYLELYFISGRMGKLTPLFRELLYFDPGFKTHKGRPIFFQAHDAINAQDGSGKTIEYQVINSYVQQDTTNWMNDYTPRTMELTGFPILNKKWNYFYDKDTNEKVPVDWTYVLKNWYPIYLEEENDFSVKDSTLENINFYLDARYDNNKNYSSNEKTIIKDILNKYLDLYLQKEVIESDMQNLKLSNLKQDLANLKTNLAKLIQESTLEKFERNGGIVMTNNVVNVVKPTKGAYYYDRNNNDFFVVPAEFPFENSGLNFSQWILANCGKAAYVQYGFAGDSYFMAPIAGAYTHSSEDLELGDDPGQMGPLGLLPKDYGVKPYKDSAIANINYYMDHPEQNTFNYLRKFDVEWAKSHLKTDTTVSIW